MGLAMLVLPGIARADVIPTPATVDFGSVASGTTTATITFNESVPGNSFIPTGDVLLDGSNFQIDSDTGVVGGNQDTVTVQFVPSSTVPGVYSDTLDFSGIEGTVGNYVSFDVRVPLTATIPTPPPTPISILSSGVRLHSWNDWSSLVSFYPLVRDFYKDTVDYGASFNERGSGIVRVTNDRTGRTIKTFSFSNVKSVSEVWNGHKSNGTKVKPGYYHFETYVSTATSSTHGASRPVIVKTGFRIERKNTFKLGRYGVVAHAGCPGQPDGNGYLLDCSSGAGGYITYARTFSKRALKGTRGMSYIWYYHNGPVSFGRTWIVGRTIYQNINVASFSWAEITQVEWSWKIKVRI